MSQAAKVYLHFPIGLFFLPTDQQNDFPKRDTNYEGLAYLGGYPLAWAACLCNETIYNLLLEKGADPDAQDAFGNSVLHMVVVANQMVITQITIILPCAAVLSKLFPSGL